LRSVATASSDPQAILDAIKATYGVSSFATQHNALQAFLAVRQESSETITAFISHVREALRYLQSTRPHIATLAIPAAGSVGYSLVDSDKELLISVLLQGTKYTALTTSLLTQSELTVQQVEDALKNEEAHRLGVTAAAAASAASSVSNSAAPASSVCAFCHMNGHTVERCWKFEEYSKKAQEEVKANSNNSNSNSRKRRPRKDNKDNKGKANTAQENQTPTESAGAASVRPPTSSSLMPGMQTQGPLLI